MAVTLFSQTLAISSSILVDNLGSTSFLSSYKGSILAIVLGSISAPTMGSLDLKLVLGFVRDESLSLAVNGIDFKSCQRTFGQRKIMLFPPFDKKISSWDFVPQTCKRYFL